MKNTNDCSEYIFEEAYQLNSIDIVEEIVKENNHQLNTLSIKAVVKNCINVAEINAKLLRKIEELWLHTIEINKEKETLQAHKIYFFSKFTQ